MLTLNIDTKQRHYPIYCGPIPDYLEFKSKVLLVTDSKVAALHLSALMPKIKAKACYICVIQEGESNKNMRSIEHILNMAFHHRLDRHSTMIALGGGVIGDMVGFASGIFMRGIDFVQIPTTLLAQVDASIGGKTGINNDYGKNLVGLFHQPNSVYVDTFFLKTLSTRESNAGIAEIIKIAATFDEVFFKWLEEYTLDTEEHLMKAIVNAIEIKKKVVQQDTKELGMRAALNYGHTFGHVIEKESGYGYYLHGEAVSIGIVMANQLALSLGCLKQEEEKRIKHLLKKNDLPICYRIKNIETFYDSLFLDKKSENSKIKFVLPKGIGDFLFYSDFSKAEIMRVLEEFCKD